MSESELLPFSAGPGLAEVFDVCFKFYFSLDILHLLEDVLKSFKLILIFFS